MRILQLCKKFPYPVKDGESLAIINLSKALVKNGCQVSLLAMNTSRHKVNIDLDAKALNHYKEIQTVEVDNSIKAVDAFQNLFSKASYHIVRFISKDFEQALIDYFGKTSFDIIQLETLYLTPYIPIIKAHTKAAIALRAHNIEFEIWERITQNTQNPLKKLYLSHLTKKLKRFEIEQLQAFDLLVAISERDRQKFLALGCKKNTITTPIGIDSSNYIPEQIQANLSLSFIGSLDWMPNIEGLNWFLEHIWPTLNQRFSNIPFHIAGRNTPNWLIQTTISGVFIHGEVESAIDFINSHPIMIVPLLSGSGMRVKILEGMALGRAVVTTSVGLEGIAAKNYESVIIADSAEEYLAAIQYLSKADNALKMGLKARQLIEQSFDSEKIAADLKNTYDLLKQTI